MASGNSGAEDGRQPVLFWVALVAALAGVGLIAVFYVSQDDAPEARSSGTTSPLPTAGRSATDEDSRSQNGSRADKPTDGETHRTAARTLTASRPVSIEIDAIDVQSEVIKIGKNPDGTLAVPEGDDIDKAAWFVNSPTPGQLGPSVIEGHIDTVDGPSVFYRLAELEPDDKVRVKRADGKVAVFTVTGVRGYPTKDEFPTDLVYGGDLRRATLRLVTCSNFDPSTGHYAGNTVVYSTLTDVRTPTATN